MIIKDVSIYKCIFVLLNFPQLYKYLEKVLFRDFKCNVMSLNKLRETNNYNEEEINYIIFNFKLLEKLA